MFSQVEKTLFNLRKYTTPNIQKKIIGFIMLFIRFETPRKMWCITSNSNVFFGYLSNMFYLNHL